MLLPHILYLALKLILVNRLQKILYCSGKLRHFAEFTDFADSLAAVPRRSQPGLSEISVHRVQDHRVQDRSQSWGNLLWYVSPVAFKLSKPNQQSAVELALEVTEAWNRDTISTLCTDATTSPLLTGAIWQNFTAQTASPGWIHLKLNEVGLQAWLNTLCSELSALILKAEQSSAADLPELAAEVTAATGAFPVLATHARCCTLLRLGVQAQLIQLEQSSSAIWTLTQPAAFPWLDADRRFRCTHPSEWQLLTQIVDALDELASALQLPPARLWQLAQRLSQAFQFFHAHCRIFGEIQTTDRPLAQTRLGLVFLTQALLNWLLRDWLHVSSPTEL